MLRSIAVANVNPSISCRTVLILGIGNGVRIKRLFTSLKLVKKRTVWFAFGIMKAGEPHSDSGCLFSTPIPSSLSTSFLKTANWLCGTGYGLPWYGFAPNCKLKWTGSVWKSPSVPSDNYLCRSSIVSNFTCCWEERWSHVSVTIAGRSAFSYLASKFL